MPRRVLLSFLILVSVWAQAQKPARSLPPSSFKLKTISVKGNKVFSEQEIIGATGLQIGQTVSDADFKIASQHLGDTGAFNNVVYSFQYSSDGTRLELQVAETDKLIPARFDNFVWFSDQDLQEKLQARVPMFHGLLPLSGSLADQVSDVLQALLIESKVNGRANYIRTGRMDGPIEAFEYTVSGPAIHIRNIDFVGAGPSELPLLQNASRTLHSGDYLRSVVRAHADHDFLPIYLARGYLKAAFADAQAKVVEQSPDETLVDVTVSVDPGRQYKLADLQLSGYKAFPADQLIQLIHVKPGEIVNAIQLADDCEAIQKLYGTRGYMAASVQSTPQMDDSQSTARYLLVFHEGDVYKMGDIDIRGLDSRTTARLVGEWKLRGDDAFDSSYPRKFVQEALKEVSLMGDWNVAMNQSVNEKDKTVDVTIRFDPKR